MIHSEDSEPHSNHSLKLDDLEDLGPATEASQMFFIVNFGEFGQVNVLCHFHLEIVAIEKTRVSVSRAMVRFVQVTSFMASEESCPHVHRALQLDKRCGQLQKEKELIDKKMQRIEKAKDQEARELRDKLDAAQGDVRTQLKIKDDKINEVGGTEGGAWSVVICWSVICCSAKSTVQ